MTTVSLLAQEVLIKSQNIVIYSAFPWHECASASVGPGLGHLSPSLRPGKGPTDQ